LGTNRFTGILTVFPFLSVMILIAVAVEASFETERDFGSALVEPADASVAVSGLDTFGWLALSPEVQAELARANALRRHTLRINAWPLGRFKEVLFILAPTNKSWGLCP
jgi:hypothetical protein